MTRPSQKAKECRSLNEFLQALSLTPDKICKGEGPDFILTVSDRTIGVEVTTYHSETRVGKRSSSRRAVEAEWESLLQASRKCQSTQADIANVNVGLMFVDVVPPQRKHPQFITDVVTFIHDHMDEISSIRTKFLSRKFVSPLMKKYLRKIILRRSESAEWYSNITVGWVMGPNATLQDIVSTKANDVPRYNHSCDELWLIVQCSHRISETALPLDGVDRLNEISLQGGPFTKIFLLGLHGNFQWERSFGWQNLNA